MTLSDYSNLNFNATFLEQEHRYIIPGLGGVCEMLNTLEAKCNQYNSFV